MSEIEIGDVRADELDAMLELMCEAFALPFAPARDIFYSDPYFDIRNKRVLRLRGRIVSCLTIVETDCWLGEGVARIAGIAGVATRQTERSKGYAGLLLTETLSTLRERGFALSALFPFSYDYYRKFGYELAGVAHRCQIRPAQLPHDREAARVRSTQTTDIPYLERLYDAAAQQQTLRAIRDTKRWNYILDHVKQRVVYAPERNAVAGYLLYEYRPGVVERIAPPKRVPPTLRLLEMVAETPEARRGLLGHLAQQSHVGHIEYEATETELERNGFLSAEGGNNANASGNVEIQPSLMVRVIHLQAVLNTLTTAWPFEGTLGIILHDPLHAEGGEAAVLAGGATSTPILPDAARSLPDHLEGDVRVWAPVLVGHLRGEDACLQGLLHASTPHAAALAGQLFPQRTPYLPPTDHF